MNYATQKLKNGLSLSTITGLSSNAVTITAYIRGGFRFDPKNRPGLSHFTEHIIFNAANNFPKFRGLVKSVEKSGGWRSAFTWIEHQEHVVHLPKNHFEEGLKLLLGTIFDCHVTESEIKKEKGVVKEEILRNKADPSRAIWDFAWFPLFFQETDLARPYSGRINDISMIGKSDVKSFAINYFSPKNTVLFIAGDLDQEYIKDTLEENVKYTNDFRKTEETVLLPRVKNNVFVHEDESYYQTSLSIGIKTVPFDSQEKQIFEIIREMLAGYFGTSLIQQLRNEGGLIYNWESFQDNLSDIGYLLINVTVAHENVNRVASIIIKEFKRFLNNKFSDDEIEMAKGHLIGSILANTETGRDYIRWYGLQELLNSQNVLGIEEQVVVYKKIKNIDIRDVATRYFKNENTFIAVVGRANKETLQGMI